MAYSSLAKILLVLLLPISIGHSATIVSYSFGSDSASGTIIADIGSAISTISWNSGGSVGYSNEFSSQGAALSVGAFQTSEYYQVTLNATGLTGISLNSFRANGTNTAPVDWKNSYSLTGTSGTFVDASTFSISSASGAGVTTFAGFALPTGANDNASVVLRFIATTSTRVDGNIAAANGTFRIDNISFEGTSAVPEPSTYALFGGLAVLGLAAFRRRHTSRLPSAP